MNVKAIALDMYMSLCRAFKGIDKKKVLFVSFGGKSYSDNPKSISEELHKIAPDLEIVWLFDDSEAKTKIVPSYVRVVDSKSNFAYFKEMATCAVMVNNFSFSKVKKSNKQMFIQTWHGDRAFKKVLYDSPFVGKDYSVSEAMPGYCDLAIAGSDYGESQYRTAFRYKGEVLKVGTPRDDLLVKNLAQDIERIRKSIGVSVDTKLLLYAPTLRRKNHNDGSVQEIQEIDIERTLDALEEKYNCKWICLMRAHPAVQNLGGFKESPRILDVAKYEDMADLLLVADMLITDYSSSAGDYALLGRPLVLFQSDIEEYIEKDRSFYFDMKDSPYFTAQNQGELEELIKEFKTEEIRANCKAILSFYGTNETGRASHAVAERIINFINK